MQENEPPEWAKRVLEELKDVVRKHDALTAFLSDDEKVSKIDRAQVPLLAIQQGILQAYENTLVLRLAAIGFNPTKILNPDIVFN